MKFKINNTEWEIKEVDEATMNNKMEDNDTLGATFFRKHEIWLVNNNINKIRTLKHELVHVWLWEYGHNQHEKEFNTEDVCEIVASSNDFINEVVEQYKNSKKSYIEQLKKSHRDDYIDALKYAIQRKEELDEH